MKMRKVNMYRAETIKSGIISTCYGVADSEQEFRSDIEKVEDELIGVEKIDVAVNIREVNEALKEAGFGMSQIALICNLIYKSFESVYTD